MNLYLQEIGYKVAAGPSRIIEYDNKRTEAFCRVAQKLVEKDKVQILCFGTTARRDSSERLC